MWGRLSIQRGRLSFLLPGLLPEFSLLQPLAPEAPGPSLPLPPPGLPLWGAGPRDCSAPPGPQPCSSWCGLPMGCGQLWDGIGQGSLTGWCGWHSALDHLEPLARQMGKFWCRRGRRFQLKLRKWPEPTPSAERGGREARCVYQDQSRASQSQGPWGGGCTFSGGVSAPTALQGPGRARRLTVPNAETLLSL